WFSCRASNRMSGRVETNKPGEPTMRSYRRRVEEDKRKAADRQSLRLQLDLPLAELIAGLHPYIEGQLAKVALTVIKRIMEEEIKQRVGPWGRRGIHRHGHQPGFVVLQGRKVPLERPRLRSIRDDKEVPLQSYKAFQSEPKMKESVTRLLARHCSTRNYEGA